jgi:hypothetical protein
MFGDDSPLARDAKLNSDLDMEEKIRRGTAIFQGLTDALETDEALEREQAKHGVFKGQKERLITGRVNELRERPSEELQRLVDEMPEVQEMRIS